jgi:hypothetical protein
MLGVGGPISRDVEEVDVSGCARVVAGAKALACNGVNANRRRVDRRMVVWAGSGAEVEAVRRRGGNDLWTSQKIPVLWYNPIRSCC